MGGAVQGFDAFDDQRVGADALDFGAHGLQACGEVGDFGFTGGVFQRGDAVGQAGRHEDVFRGADGDEGEDEFRAFQALRGGGVDIAAIERDFGAHGLEALEVQVDRAGADGAAAGQGHAGLADARQQGAEDEDGGAHFAHDVVGRLGVCDAPAKAGGAALGLDGDAVLGQQIGHCGEVGQLRDIGEGQALISEQAAGHERQCGIFGAGDGDGAVERYAAGDANRVHLQPYILGSETPRWPIYLPDLSA